VVSSRPAPSTTTWESATTTTQATTEAPTLVNLLIRPALLVPARPLGFFALLGVGLEVTR
jgi:hypothetical protein